MMDKPGWVVTWQYGNAVILAWSEEQLKAWLKLQFGNYRYIISPATELNINWARKGDKLYEACISGGKR